jgi:hypothetical protein
MSEKKMDRAMVLVPYAGGKSTMVVVQNRHVTEIPGPGDKEVVFDTTLDPEAYPDNVTAAAALAKLINNGRYYEMVREGIISELGELEDILGDLEDDNVNISGSSRLALFRSAINSIHEIGRRVHFDMVSGGRKEGEDGGRE